MNALYYDLSGLRWLRLCLSRWTTLGGRMGSLDAVAHPD